MVPRSSSWKAVALLWLGALATLPSSLTAQMPRSRESRPDFLFGRPRVTVGLRAGYAMPLESPGDIFTQVPADQQLQSKVGNFNSASVSGELAVRVTERLDIVGDFGYSGAKIRSESKEWLDNNDNPIEQTVHFTRRTVTFGLKEYLWARGQSVGHLAWIPQQWAPFVGAGAGWVWYDYKQDGDFVDFQTLDVFPDRFVSSGRAATVHFFAGADWSLAPSFMLTLEGRYSLAKSPMTQDFKTFNKIDLSGFQASAGISLRF